jgi:hypothetical protein
LSGHAAATMPFALAILSRHWTAAAPGKRHRSVLVLLIGLHLAALIVFAWSEMNLVAGVAVLLAWGLLNFLWLAVLRRPAVSAALALTLTVVLILVSQYKHSTLLMTANFLDLILIDRDTVSFLFMIYPSLTWIVAAAALLVFPAYALLWWYDPFRVRLTPSLAGAAGCFVMLTGLSLAVPSDPYDDFYSGNYVSKFVRSGVTGVFDLFTRGYLESDATATERLDMTAAGGCRPAARPPHIVMIFDESSFDISAVPGIKLPAGYRSHFLSSDGKQRTLLVEGAGGPSWYTEYNVLTGLSVRSFGRFADFVTRIAADRVERGLPRALRRCGYRTFSLYPMMGIFAGARSFQTTTGIEHFLDARALGVRGVEPDAFFYDAAARLIARERGDRPLFLFVYTTANHFPWNFRFRPELTPGWRTTGNTFEVDEYLRRQTMSARDYRAFIARLESDFPGEAFLIIRFGDHQPSFAKHLIDPALDDSLLARRIAEADPRYLATYYAIEGVNAAAALSSALPVLDAPYLPLVVIEAAGLPLDPSFAAQKRILQRCRGLFYRCAGGAEARRFNRLLIDAGLIKGL